MQLPDVLCYIFLTITVVASCVEADDSQSTELTDSEPERRINKREAMILDNYEDSLYSKPNVIYKRVLQTQRYASPRTKYGPPRPHYKASRPTKPNRKPGKKYKRYHKPNFLSSKHLPPTPKHKRNSKPRYGSRSKPRPPSFHKPSGPKPASFGEPPTDYSNDYQAPKQTYGEPPTDSYGAPLNPKNDEYNYNRQTYPVWANDDEASFAFSNKHPAFAKPESDDTFVKRIPQDHNEVLFRKREKDKNYYKKKKPQYINEMYSASMNKPKKAHKDLSKPKEEIVVGGQYAEPPARYIARFQPSAPMVDEEDEFAPLYGYVNPKVASPYMNYKNSNLAFSPQNLNDAFSLVDK